jgi:hypothetical protein
MRDDPANAAGAPSSTGPLWARDGRSVITSGNPKMIFRCVSGDPVDAVLSKEER